MKKSLSKAQFSLVVKDFPRLHEHTIDAVRRLLVEGELAANLAAEYDVTRQKIEKTAKRVLTYFLDVYGDCPPDWPVARFCFPPELKKDVAALERKAKSLLKKKRSK